MTNLEVYEIVKRFEPNLLPFDDFSVYETDGVVQFSSEIYEIIYNKCINSISYNFVCRDLNVVYCAVIASIDGRWQHL